jgi:cytochrome c peroxidase
MGRLIAIVIVLVAIALWINSSSKQVEVEPPPGAVVDVPAEGDLVEIGAPVEAKATAAEPASSESAVAMPVFNEPGEPTTNKPAPAGPALVATAPAAPPEVAAEKPPVIATEESYLLGSGDLLGGIPGDGNLTLEELGDWLEDPQNHVVLKPELPLGLAAGAAKIEGIDANPLTRAKIELGRQLYFDTRLSADGSISCASCHDPDAGYAKATQFGVGIEDQTGNRNSPTAYNRIVSGKQFWDGRAESLEAQAVGPIANPIEMGNTHESCVASLAGVPGYVKQFEQIFPDGLTIENVGMALASFERCVVTGPAPWDYHEQLSSFEKTYAVDLEDLELLQEEDPELYDEYMELKQQSETHPISEAAVRGGELFFSDKSGCTACHVGANFTDELYHNLGVGMDAEEPDLGRFVETNDDKDRGAFKTPTVRNVALTSPYMHDGSQKTLAEVVEWYAKGGHPNEWLSDKVKKLELSDQDKADLVEFMADGLKGELPMVRRDRLPE